MNIYRKIAVLAVSAFSLAVNQMGYMGLAEKDGDYSIICISMGPASHTEMYDPDGSAPSYLEYKAEVIEAKPGLPREVFGGTFPEITMQSSGETLFSVSGYNVPSSVKLSGLDNHLKSNGFNVVSSIYVDSIASDELSNIFQQHQREYLELMNIIQNASRSIHDLTLDVLDEFLQSS